MAVAGAEVKGDQGLSDEDVDGSKDGRANLSRSVFRWERSDPLRSDLYDCAL